MPREKMEYDVVIVGAGPAGLASAIHLKQLNAALQVCILEKGAAVGAHTLSGAVFEPRALDELIPDWREKGAPLQTPVTRDQLLLLTSTRAYPLPTPSPMQNAGNYIISLGKLCRWLGQQAEALGVEIFPGFAAAEILFDAAGSVCGVATSDRGIDKHQRPTAQFQPGVELRARQTFFAEGCHGSLTKLLLQHFNLTAQSDPQTYGIGIKELWEVPSAQHRPGTVTHSIGWPLTTDTYGGSFLYHLENNRIALGMVIGLDYQNPYLSPFDELQRLKHHPAIKSILVGGQRLAYGARALVEGGFQAIPKLTFPGGVLIGDTAGLLNALKIKGTHTAMKSGMLAAAAFNAAHQTPNTEIELKAYAQQLTQSWVWPELYKVRNIRPSFKKGLVFGLIYSAIDTYLLRGHAPWTFHHNADHLALKKAVTQPKISYPKPDNVISFDKLSSVYLTQVDHPDNQPCHLQLKDPHVAIAVNYADYAAPEQRYCPAGVYEILMDQAQQPYLQINAQNCIHCKICDIKDPTQNINWITPMDGGGPSYNEM